MLNSINVSIYASNEPPYGNLIVRIKDYLHMFNSFKGFIYASNEPLYVTLKINFGKNSICAYCKQIKIFFPRIK